MMDKYDVLKIENQMCFPLYAASKEIVKLYRPYLDEIDLTYTQYIVCLAMWEMGKATVGDLCRKLYLDCGTLTPLLKKMEESGWVARCRCKVDERVVYVSVTENGWALREQVKDIPMKVGECITLPYEDALQLYTLLYKLLNAMEAD